VRLDCHTRESTLFCVSRLFGVSTGQVDDFLLGLDLDAYCREHPVEGYGDTIVTMLAEREFGPIQHDLSAVSWFHLTRVLPGEDFGAGILPLGEALDGVWTTLERIFDGTRHVERLRTLRREGVSDWLFRLKVPDPFFWGPYAMLIRDAAFRSGEIGNHDYLGTPEIVQDICHGYEARFGLRIEDEVQAALHPCIVKFTSDRRLDRGCVKAAAFYLYLTVHGRPMSLHSNDCFDGGGVAVPPSEVELVEFIATEAF